MLNSSQIAMIQSASLIPTILPIGLGLFDFGTGELFRRAAMKNCNVWMTESWCNLAATVQKSCSTRLGSKNNGNGRCFSAFSCADLISIALNDFPRRKTRQRLCSNACFSHLVGRQDGGPPLSGDGFALPPFSDHRGACAYVGRHGLTGTPSILRAPQFDNRAE